MIGREEQLETIEGLVGDPDIRAVIIKGEGAVFSAGVDFASLGSLVGRFMVDSAAGGAPIRTDISRFQHYLNRLEATECLIVVRQKDGRLTEFASDGFRSAD